MAVSGVKCAKCLQTLPKHGRLTALTISFPKTSDAQGKSTTKRAWFDFDPSFASPLEAAELAEVRAPDRCICNRIGLNEKAHIPLNVRFGSCVDGSPFGKVFLDVLPFGRCGHVCGLLMRHT
jgi:hypothetical protein